VDAGRARRFSLSEVKVGGWFDKTTFARGLEGVNQMLDRLSEPIRQKAALAWPSTSP
jgi:hypothetical protein